MSTDLQRLIEQETAGWNPAAIEALQEAIAEMDAPGGWRPFYCDREGCNGKPHDNWLWPHARWDQHPPRDWGDAYVLLCLSGRGAGKTRQGSEWVHRVARQYPGCYIGMIAPTVDAARDTLVEGDSGIMRTANPAFKPVWEPSKRKLTWPNGSQAQTFSADMPERLRGPQHGWLWLDEAGTFKNFEETWSNALFGLRLGAAPKVLITTTPRPRKWLRDMVTDPQVITRRVSTYANITNLAETYKTTVIKRYEGTALGQQELEGVILDDDFGEALWQDTDFRVAEMPIPESEIGWHVIAVDPAVTSGGDETGIVVAAATAERDVAKRTAMVVGDHTVTEGGPEIWVQKVVDVYRLTPQPCVVLVEANQGGELIGGMIKQVDATIPVSYVHATRSKEVRADPIVLAYRMGRVWHKPGLEALQEQQTTWIPGVSKESPGRIDACLVAGTPVLTERGDVPIEDVTTDDRVWTRQGWKPVLWSGATRRDAPVLTLTTEHGTVTGTADHLVYTALGDWLPLGALMPGDTVMAWMKASIPEKFSGTVSGGDVTRLAHPSTAGTTSTLTAISTSTSLSGSTLTESRFPMDSTSITSTAIPTTTTPRTSWLSRLRSTLKRIWRWARSTFSTPKNAANSLPAFGHSLPSGTDPTPVVHGTASTASAPGTTVSTSLLSVRYAAPSIRRPIPTGPGTALGPASTGPGEPGTTTSSDLPHLKPARCAAPSTNQSDVVLVSAPSDVLAVTASGSAPLVYDLTVADAHEFVAGGIVVHNCVWALHGLLIDAKLLKTYGRVRTMGSVTNIRTYTAKRSPVLADISAENLSRRPGLRPPIRERVASEQ